MSYMPDLGERKPPPPVVLPGKWDRAAAEHDMRPIGNRVACLHHETVLCEHLKNAIRHIDALEQQVARLRFLLVEATPYVHPFTGSDLSRKKVDALKNDIRKLTGGMT